MIHLGSVTEDACYKALGQIPTACCINGSFGVSHRRCMLQGFGADSHSVLYKWFIWGQSQRMHVTRLWGRFPQHAVLLIHLGSVSEVLIGRLWGRFSLVWYYSNKACCINGLVSIKGKLLLGWVGGS